MAEKQKLGILVPTSKYIDYLIGVVRAAKKAGKAVCIFLTHEGCLITQDPKYQELSDILVPEAEDQLSICNVSWEELGLKDGTIPTGMNPKDLSSQSRHVTLIETCDRYLVI